MASSRVARFLSFSSNPSPSIYETIRRHDDSSDSSVVEERAGLAVDEENLRHNFNDYELDQAMEHASDTQSGQSSPFVPRPSRPRGGGGVNQQKQFKWSRLSPRTVAPEDDDDVPASLLVERDGDEDIIHAARPASPPPPLPPAPLQPRTRPDANAAAAGPSTRRIQEQWNTARLHQPIHEPHIPAPTWRAKQRSRVASADPRQKALWRWANVENLDNFLKDVYLYFLGNGIWCIVLGRVLNLL
jgi:autophagy-related protein 9